MKEIYKRVLAGMLAVLMVVLQLIYHVPSIAYAAEVRFTGKNIWKGSSISILGHTRGYLYKWKASDGKYTFCIEEGQHMGRDVRAIAGDYSINDANVPFISDKEMFSNLGLIGAWVKDRGNNLSDADYAAAQVAVWAVMRGDIEETLSLASQINSHIGGDVVASANALLAAVQEAKAKVNLGNGIYLSQSEAKENPINMELVDGHYEAKISLSRYPELKQVVWKVEEGTGFTYKVSGDNLVISYTGSGEPKGILNATSPESLAKLVSGSETLTIYRPLQDKDQAMISAGADKRNDLYINLGGKALEVSTDSKVEVYRHKERFAADYLVELEKYDYETGKALEGAIFEVLERFDASQLGDGEDGSVSAAMSPKPSTWREFRKFGEVITDADGKTSYQDVRYYQYDKIYVGHPQPEYLEVPELSDDGSNADEIEAIEAENERLQKEYEAIVALCEEEGYFHDDDIEVAREQMIEDRDRTYETFINLRYQYTFREIQAREGYILHGKHNDDELIEVIETTSSQAGAHTSIEYILPDALIVSMSAIGSLSSASSRESRASNLSLSVVSPQTFGLQIEKSEEIVAATSSDASSIEISDKVASPSNSEDIEILEDDSIYLSTDSDADKEGDTAIYRYLLGASTISSLFARSSENEEEDSVSVSIELPEPEEDDVVAIPRGNRNRVSHSFVVKNNRTEGEIHINKRDMELYAKDRDASYGQTQGDATLEGAVYGLYAGADIVHPDGKTGTVYKAGELVSIATTDRNGDASFLVYTEESETSLLKENKYQTWVGRPLILGAYYVKELSRSEGYELSVSGKNLKESNRLSTDTLRLVEAGNVSATRLSHRIDEHSGKTNDTTIRYYKTENGFSVSFSGYPEGAKLYEVKTREITERNRVVKEMILATKSDALGNVVYQKAKGGELKLDSDGNPIPLLGVDSGEYESEVLYTYHRLNLYPSGEARPSNPTKWADTLSVDRDYLVEEINGMLADLGYKELDATDGGGSPWVVLNLSATTHESIGEEIFTYLSNHSFYDSAILHSITESGGAYTATLFVDYKGSKGNSIYEPKTKTLYVKKKIEVSGGASESHIWLAYPEGSYSFSNFYAKISPRKEITGVVDFLDDVSPFIKEVKQVAYERYTQGELLLDLAGNPIPEKELQAVYEEVDEVRVEESLEELSDLVYDADTGIYTIYFPNTLDWTTIDKEKSLTLRIETLEDSIEVDGKEMYYSDYLTQVKGAGVSVFAKREEVDAGSFIEFIELLYPGQIQVYSDAGTREQARIVQERVIKQAIQITKDISRESFEENNSYRIHRDPFTVLFGGFIGQPKKFVKGFSFKAYLVSDLEKAGLLEVGEDGEYDYKKLFTDESKRSLFDTYAMAWDKPDKDIDGDLTTLHANEGTGAAPYYGRSVMLPYGTYVVVEQVPEELVNKHYEIDTPKVIELPFVPDIDGGEVQEDVASREYIYWKDYTPEELVAKFQIRFNEEDHIIQAHSHDGDFEVYKYGLKKDLLPQPYANTVIGARYKYGQSEAAGTKDGVYYELEYDKDGNLLDIGSTKNSVATMTGISTAIDGKYAKALVPYSVLDPRYGEVINDAGDIGNRDAGVENGKFNFIAFAKKHFENRLYSSKLRFEKIDAKTGENIIHDNAIFKIYATSRDIKAKSSTSLEGSGRVLFETITLTGTRAELEARGDVDNITWDETNLVFTGTVTRPVYSESEQIFMKDEMGNEVGIFKAYETEREVLKDDGSIVKEKVGYIETYQPLGAGTYVLVEVAAPDGYVKSKPIAFEVYKDEVSYYADGEEAARTKAERYQYVKPLTTTGKTEYVDVAKIEVKDKPSTMRIHKVEDGDSKVGDVNSLDGLQGVNAKGDLLTYIIRGRKEYLEARGDVENIRFNQSIKLYEGSVTKTYDEWSETLIKDTEANLLARDNVKPLYDVHTGNFSGYGIVYDIYVKDATLSLYEGLELEKTATGYLGVSVRKENGKTVEIVASRTGEYSDITMVGRDVKAPYLPIYDHTKFKKQSVSLYFYDLDTLNTEEEAGEYLALDNKGNRLSYVDISSGMAYTKDSYGRIIAYKSTEDNEKILAQSIKLQTGNKIYKDVDASLDENGLVYYYTSGEPEYKKETWKTGTSYHEIQRLPFGAYILEESEVPYESGYIKTADKGLILRESAEVQNFFFENAFTKLNVAKIDITTKKEIKDATMTLYKAKRVPDGSSKGYHLEKEGVYTSWISGYAYNDNGEMVYESGKPVETSKPHWIDHIPVGDYILEESIVPYQDGYVKSESIEIEVKETGDVQTAVMEDDYTALEIRKYDTKTGEVLDNAHRAGLSLYKASLDADGKPILEEKDGLEIPVYRRDNLLVSWQTDSGEDVKASGRLVTDEYGDSYMQYAYTKVPIASMSNAYYYIKEDGSTRFDYLPIGYYVLVEEETPIGYATAEPVLIHIEDIGSKVYVHKAEMGDVPLRLLVHKQSEVKIVKDATLEIYAMDDDGNIASSPAYRFITGSDGIYTEEDAREDRIPEGYTVGDLKPHLIEYIPLGQYVLREALTPFGFVKAEDVIFEVIDTREIQSVYMEDPIPEGLLEIVKKDSESGELLSGAKFVYRNQTLGIDIETLETDENGSISASALQPSGYLGADGYFKPYIYEVIEVSAPKTHILNTVPHEFIFSYVDDKTAKLSYTYDALNDINQVKISKKELTSQDELPGASLKVYEKKTGKLIDEWISSKEPHYIKGLEIGEYILEEVLTPEGNYAKASDIEFAITENMESIPYIEMFDDHSKVEIVKVIAGTKTALEGAKLSLQDSTGNTLYEWTSSKEGFVIAGLAAGEYVIVELEAPAGYQKAGNKKIVVQDTLEVQEFFFENYRISGGGGGGRITPNKSYISFKKQDDKGQIIPGAEFTFYKPDGSILTTATSDAQGIVKIERPADGTYTFKETKTPEGYYVNSKVYTLVLSPEGVKADFTLINVRIKEVELVKKDLGTGAVLEGAKFRITSPTGEVSEVISDTEGKIRFVAGELGAYTLEELEAPKGYKKSSGKYVIVVSEDGSVKGDAVIYNSKQKIGRIVLSYRNDFYGLPRTGDTSKTPLAWILGLLSMLGIGVWYMKKNRKKVLGMHLLALFIVGAILSTNLSFVYATEQIGSTQEIERIAGEDISRISEYELAPIILEVKQAEPQQIIKQGDKLLVETRVFEGAATAEQSMFYDGKEYRLLESSIKSPDKTSDKHELRKEIIFEKVEGTSTLPEVVEAKLLLQKGEEIEEKSIQMVLETSEVVAERWEEDFSANMTFIDYDAEEFSFGSKVFSKDTALENLRSYDKEILASLGLSGEYYKINAITWSGEAYQNGGTVYRNALVLGNKFTKDVKAVYVAEVEPEENSAYILSAEYILNESDEVEEETIEDTLAIEEKSFLQQFLRLLSHPISMALISFIVLIVGILFILSKQKKKNEIPK